MNQSAQFFHFVQDENSEMIGKVISLQFYLWMFDDLKRLHLVCGSNLFVFVCDHQR
jgi:hypothetical protein